MNLQSKKITIMEVCGTHTMSIARFGIRSMLPKLALYMPKGYFPARVTFLKSSKSLMPPHWVELLGADWFCGTNHIGQFATAVTFCQRVHVGALFP